MPDIINRPYGFTPVTRKNPVIANPRVPSADDTPEAPVKRPPSPGGTITPLQGEKVSRLLFDKFNNDETKFTSLKFSKDSFDGSTSSEPLIYKSISVPRIGKIANPRVIAKENEERVSLLLNTTGRGIEFLKNQQNLTFSNSRLESIGNQSSKLRFTSLAFYNPDLTLKQIGRDPSEQGEHYTRFGISPFMDDSLKYTGVVTKNNLETTNRLSKLRKNLGIEADLSEDIKVWKDKTQSRLGITTDFTSGLRGIAQGIGGIANTVAGINSIFGGNANITNIANRISNVSRAVVNYLTPTIDQYQGGPGSINGIGTTTIRRFDYTNNYAKTKFLKEIVKSKLPSTPNVAPILTQSKFETEAKSLDQTKQTQLREIAIETDANDMEKGYTYAIARVNPATISSATIRNKQNINWSRNQGTGLVSAISSLNPSIKNGKLKNIYDDKGIEDISWSSNRMPIVFEIMDPFTGTISADNTFKFSAYLNGFKDSSSPKHTEISYIGRSDYFYVFNKFKRDVSFSFQIPCYNLADLRSKHRSLAALYSSTMGKYQNNRLGGILYYLTIGNYLNKEVGIITNMSYDIPNDTSWDIDEQLAHNLNVSISYTVIHNYLPQYDSDGDNLFVIGANFPISINSTNSDPINKYADVKNLGPKSIKQSAVNKPSMPTLTVPPINPSNAITIPKSGGGMLGGANQ
jgi:hypothetical protein